MFSGLVQDLCPVVSISKSHIQIQSPPRSTRKGESIAVNGVCLTVTDIKRKSGGLNLGFDISPETLKKTNLVYLRPGSHVNVERCLTLNDLLGGHLVQGHVDGVGQVTRIKKMGPNRDIWIKGPSAVLNYVVSKGSVSVNGVSLTAVKVTPATFSVALIPYTLRHTNLGTLKIGDKVNLEADIIGKYVEKFTRKT